jgi:hypothetical protein
MHTIICTKCKPFLYLPNYGDVWVNEGDVVTIDGDGYVRLSGLFEYTRYHRHIYKVTNVLSELASLENVLNGNGFTTLEIDLAEIERIHAKIPYEDFYIVFWQPYHINVKKVIYNAESKTWSSGHGAYSLENTAWYLYRNGVKMLPDSVSTCTNEEWHKYPKL